MTNSPIPLVEVVEVDLVPGPRGGLILIRVLACGHTMWTRVQRPPRAKPRPVACVGCYLARSRLVPPA